MSGAVSSSYPVTRIRAIVWWVIFLASPVLLGLGGWGIFRLFFYASAQEIVDQKQIFAALNLATLPLLLFAFMASAIAVNYLRSREIARAEMELAGMKSRQRYHQDFIRMIADNRPGATLVLDGAGRLWFANTQAAQHAALSPQDMVGKPLEKALPEDDILRLMPLIRRARAEARTVEEINRVRRGMETHYVKSQIIPLPATANLQDAVMINEDDITNLLVEREARERMFRQVIDTLVAVVDRRDPYAAGHSVRVGQLARAIAEQLRLDGEQIETAEIAGLLMNFGKVLVPRAILVKATALSPDELKQVHDSLMASADILALIGFSQPVVPTLRQVLEHVDGKGIPQGLAGEAIMLTARIVAVANAFVALLSARAHRPGLGVAAALDILNTQSGKAYDRRVIEALTAYIAADAHQMEWLSGR